MKTRRRQRKQEASAEDRDFATIYQRKKKNRLSQLLLVLALGATFAGGGLMAVGSLVGFIMVIVGLPATIAISVWMFKRWDY